MRRSRWLIATAILIVVGVIAYFIVQRHQERRALHGTWTANGMILTVTDQFLNLIQIAPDGKTRTMRMYYTLDPSTTPKQITTIDADNPNNTPNGPGSQPNNTCPGIYEVNGNTLRLCIGNPGGTVPNGFEGSEGMVRGYVQQPSHNRRSRLPPLRDNPNSSRCHPIEHAARRLWNRSIGDPCVAYLHLPCRGRTWCF
jgi:uncharacterized protein (TIGR03067 family)